MVQNLKLNRILWDISGAFGDIGVLVPIAVALIAKNGFNPTALFLCAGAFYLISAFYFRITMPVQPLKAMSVIAITAGLSSTVMTTAGFIMGLLLVVISVTGVSVKLAKLFPVSVIRGIQLGLGILLIKTGLGYMSGDLTVFFIALSLLGIFLFFKSKIPPLVFILFMGTAIALNKVTHLEWGFLPLQPNLPAWDQMGAAFTLLVLPQIALTLGNAIIATENTAKILYPEQVERLNLKSIPMSMGIANIFSAIFGGVPMCHGSGGLTAHAKFGATSARSGYIIGIFLILLGFTLGKSSLALISVFPAGILGVLLLYVGVLHGSFIRDILNDRSSVAIAIVTALIGVFFNNITIGFLVGIALHHLKPFIVIKSHE